MNNPDTQFNNFDRNDYFDFKNEFYKYLFYWKYFVLSIIFFLFFAFCFTRYSPKIYNTNAKIKILDKKESSLELPSAADLFSNSKINLENELQVLQSYSILEKVVRNLNLTNQVYGVGNIMELLIIDYPFRLINKVSIDNISSMQFELAFSEKGLEIYDLTKEKTYFFDNFNTTKINHDLPFDITSLENQKLFDKKYIVLFNTIENTILSLKKKISAESVGKSSDIISINFNSTNKLYSEKVLNELINVFNQDGINDRQLIHKRTIDFVNERYIYLSSELDSIEISKELFKIKNDLVDLNTNSKLSLEKSSFSEENIFTNETQSYIVSNLLESLYKSNFALLPSNIGLNYAGINNMINSYNKMIIDRKNFISSAGPSHPTVKQLNISIEDSRINIISSLENYLIQLKSINVKLSEQFNKFDSQLSSLPRQEKNLRAIERNQQIKESLYLFLLQKGEEAQVSYAVTEPSIKVVEYAISNSEPFSPKTNIIFLVSLIIGFILPFTILYIIFLFDTKIHSREALDNAGLNIIGEIPFFDLEEKDKVFLNPDDRSIISEAFRMVMSNVRYLQKDNTKSNVILVTSSIKGEGKTLNALNLSLSFSSVDKKVLLIGCDLRNPQLHKYLNLEKNVPGVVDYLVDNKVDWKKNVLTPFDNQSLDVLLSGPLPPNSLSLINNGNIDLLLNEARKIYDYIIIDSAPTLLVADTKSLVEKSDILIYLTRCNVTDQNILNHIVDISNETNSNLGVILNGVGEKNAYGYSYGYKYGYGYNYKYSYNYGYGYGYNEES
tara:strand:+ start:10687 stop:13038 length:2352 start_codon:yes stop_codon:yes gene_type:complete